MRPPWKAKTRVVGKERVGPRETWVRAPPGGRWTGSLDVTWYGRQNVPRDLRVRPARQTSPPQRVCQADVGSFCIGAGVVLGVSSSAECPMSTEPTARLHRWDDLPREKVTEFLDRRLICGERMMLAHIYLKKGCIVPAHSHHNEQLTYILEGGLRFWIGEDESQVIDVMAGEVLHIPSMVQHKAEALEDTLDVDIFSPPRQDWLDKTDDYLRQK